MISAAVRRRHGLGRIGVVVVRVEFMNAGRHLLDEHRPLLGELFGRNSAFGAGHHVVDADQDIAGKNDVIAHAGKDLRPFTKLRGAAGLPASHHPADAAGRDSRLHGTARDLLLAGLPGRPIGRSGGRPAGWFLPENQAGRIGAVGWEGTTGALVAAGRIVSVLGLAIGHVPAGRNRRKGVLSPQNRQAHRKKNRDQSRTRSNDKPMLHENRPDGGNLRAELRTPR